MHVERVSVELRILYFKGLRGGGGGDCIQIFYRMMYFCP